MTELGHLQVYDLTLRTCSPLFIGNGKTCSKKEYLYTPSSGKVSMMDMDKLFDLLVDRNLADEYERFVLSADGRSLSWFLNEICHFGPAETNPLRRYTIPAQDALDENHSLKDISCFLRNGAGQVYVPGSSVKGALRTDLLVQKMEGRSPANSYDELHESQFLHTLHCTENQADALNSLLRGVQISDSQPVSDSRMMLAREKSVLPDGRDGFLPICRECIKPGTELHLKLTLDQSILKGTLTAETICSSLSGFLDYYHTVWADRFQDGASLPRGTYLLLGGGAGYVSKTVTYAYYGPKGGLEKTADVLRRSFWNHKHEEDAARGVSPHTLRRTRCNGVLYPFGLCEVLLS